MHTKFWLEYLKEGDHWEYLGEDNIRMDLREIGW
jgi:hypothetical protein